MSYEANLKGKQFENKVAKILDESSIIFEREKRIKGYGKNWRVDFYLPNRKTIVECKNIQPHNLRRCLQETTLKFLDIRNRYLQMQFLLIFPEPSFSMSSFARFCTKYRIKMSIPSQLPKALSESTKQLNKKFGLLNRPLEKAIKLVRESGEQGITKKEISKRIGWRMKYHTPLDSINMGDYGIIKSKLSPTRYFPSQKAYRESNEYLMLQDLIENWRKFPDHHFAKKYGFNIRRITYQRQKMGLDKSSIKHTRNGIHTQTAFNQELISYF